MMQGKIDFVSHGTFLQLFVLLVVKQVDNKKGLLCLLLCFHPTCYRLFCRCPPTESNTLFGHFSLMLLCAIFLLYFRFIWHLNSYLPHILYTYINVHCPPIPVQGLLSMSASQQEIDRPVNAQARQYHLLDFRPP